MTATSLSPKPTVSSAPAVSAATDVRVRVRAKRLALYTVLVSVTGLFLGPFGWLILSGLKTQGELAASPVHWLPDVFQWHTAGRGLRDVRRADPVDLPHRPARLRRRDVHLRTQVTVTDTDWNRRRGDALM